MGGKSLAPVHGMTPILEVQNLHVAYSACTGELCPALAGVSFGLGQGEILGILGESGSGKSSLAASLLRLLPPNGKIQKGKVRFEGKNLLDASAQYLRKIRGGRIGLILQEPSSSLQPTLRIGQQVSDVLAAHESLDRRTLKEKTCELLASIFHVDAESHLPLLSASIERRPAPTRLDSASDCLPPFPNHRRRTHRVARPHDATRNPAALPDSPPRARPRDDFDHSQSRPALEPRGSHPRSLCRPSRRNRPGSQMFSPRLSILTRKLCCAACPRNSPRIKKLEEPSCTQSQAIRLTLPRIRRAAFSSRDVTTEWKFASATNQPPPRSVSCTPSLASNSPADHL